MYSLAHILTDIVKSYGDNIAVCDDYHRVTYRELDRYSSWVTQQLKRYAVKKGDKVALLLDKSVMAIASIYGIFKAGTTYVPLDAEAPIEKTASIIKECNIQVVIATTDISELLTSISEIYNLPCKPLFIGNSSADLAVLDSQFVSVSKEEVVCTEESTAALLFTSGSTGKPKGVVISHGNILCFLEWVCHEFELDSSDRLVSHAPLFFDLSLLDIFAALKVGACVYLVDRKKTFNHIYLNQLIQKEKITVWQSVPSALKALSLSDNESKEEGCSDAFSHMKKVLFAGEKLSGKFIQRLMNKFTKASFYNIYGCTETNDTFFYAIPNISPEAIPDVLPIGLPLPYVKYQILDIDGKAATEGELYVNAPTNMQGYYSSDSPFVVLDDGLEYYKTGDLVSVDSSGLLSIQGRVSNIVKVNGNRVSLLEVEDVISNIPEVAEVMVFIAKDEADVDKLIAVIYSEKEQLSKLGIRRFCADHLTRYKRPDIIIVKKEPLAKTPTGKIDRLLIEKNEMIGG